MDDAAAVETIWPPVQLFCSILSCSGGVQRGVFLTRCTVISSSDSAVRSRRVGVHRKDIYALPGTVFFFSLVVCKRTAQIQILNVDIEPFTRRREPRALVKDGGGRKKYFSPGNLFV